MKNLIPFIFFALLIIYSCSNNNPEPEPEPDPYKYNPDTSWVIIENAVPKTNTKIAINDSIHVLLRYNIATTVLEKEGFYIKAYFSYKNNDYAFAIPASGFLSNRYGQVKWDFKMKFESFDLFDNPIELAFGLRRQTSTSFTDPIAASSAIYYNW